MGSITTGIGLISGIDTASLIDSLITLESGGKVRLQQRIGVLQAQQTALMDINARLLNFKNASRAFRIDRIFRSALATSGNPEILTAIAGNTAQPGSFQFIVKQLVSTSQMLSGGYADIDTSPLGLDDISFEFGAGRLARETDLADLNGGQGVDRGRIEITDSTGDTASIDLTDVTTLDEVLDRINESTGVSVTASVEGDHLVVTDTAGGAGTLSIDDATGDTTATDLGITNAAVGGVITGSDINTLGANTPLSSLNDGNGVLIAQNVADFKITARDGTVYNIDLGRIDLPIDDDTLLSDLNNGAGVTIDDDDETPDIKFIARNGSEYEVDLTDVTTIGGLKSRIATETGGDITITVDADGDQLVVTSVNGASDLQVLGAGPNGTAAAEDLGILNENGVSADSFSGDIIPSLVDSPAATTIQDVIDRINNALDTGEVANGGHIVASINASGTGIQIVDTVSGAGNLIVESLATNPDAASDLGLEASIASDTITGNRLIAGLNSVLVRSLNGGTGLGGAVELTVTDREGHSQTVSTLDTFDTLSELVDFLNTEFIGGGVVDVTFSLNSAGNGLLATDTSGGTGNLTITSSDGGAAALGIEADVAADTVYGENLQLQYVSNAAKLEDLNYGRGVGTGKFQITDGLGATATVTIGGDEESLYDVITEINSRGLAITARVNDNGDGIIIEEDAAALGGQTAFTKIKVETVNGTTASDLNILGESEDVEGGYIDGSYERSVDLNVTDALEDVVSKINSAGIPVSASILNTGGGATPYRLNVTSGITGRAGALTVDTGGVDLGFSEISRGQDAKVFFGADNPEDGFLVTSSTNTLEDVLQGVTIDLHQASDAPVTLTVARDTDAIVEAVKQFVTTFNDVIGRIDEYDYYDVDTEQKGVLLGDPTAARIRTALYGIATGSALNLDGSYQYLTQVGISFNSDGQLKLDESAFRDALANDRQAVEDLFAAYDVTTTSSQTIGQGITVNASETTYNALGFGSLFDRLLEDLTDSIDGVVTLADSAFQSQIDLLESRVEDMDARLEARREILTRQFMAMETALAQLQNQGGALTSLAANVQLASTQLTLGGT